MTLINSSYFIGERNIPNTLYPEVSSLIDHLISEHQEEYLTSLMGYELFKLFEAGLLVTPTPDQKWLDIKNGVAFTGLDGRAKKWAGFVNATTLLSPIADYVYYWYSRNNSTQTAAMGEVQSKNENSSNVSSAGKQVRAWNDMVAKNKLLNEFLQVNYSTYPEFQQHSGARELRNLLIRINANNF